MIWFKLTSFAHWIPPEICLHLPHSGGDICFCDVYVPVQKKICVHVCVCVCVCVCVHACMPNTSVSGDLLMIVKMESPWSHLKTERYYIGNALQIWYLWSALLCCLGISYTPQTPWVHILLQPQNQVTLTFDLWDKGQKIIFPKPGENDSLFFRMY